MPASMPVCTNLSLKCNLALSCRYIGTLWAPLFLCGNFRLRIPRLAMRQNMRPSSGRQSCPGVGPTGVQRVVAAGVGPAVVFSVLSLAFCHLGLIAFASKVVSGRSGLGSERD